MTQGAQRPPGDDDDIVAAGFRVELHPAGDCGSSHGSPIVLEPKKDHVADHEAVVVARDKLLGLVAAEVGEGIHAEVGNEPSHIGTLHVRDRQVIRLIHQRNGFTPCVLLIGPVRELRRNRGNVRVAASPREVERLKPSPHQEEKAKRFRTVEADAFCAHNLKIRDAP